MVKTRCMVARLSEGASFQADSGRPASCQELIVDRPGGLPQELLAPVDGALRGRVSCHADLGVTGIEDIGPMPEEFIQALSTSALERWPMAMFSATAAEVCCIDRLLVIQAACRRAE